MNERITYLSEIINALDVLGGMATLSEINKIIVDRNILVAIYTNKNWKDNVRATLQRHCSDTKSFRGANNLFYSVYGLGEGVWGLRNYTKIQGDINPFEKRKILEIEQDSEIDSTEKETLILARKGQGKFRKNLLKKFNNCLITGIKNNDLLMASHIKPWRSSNNYERLSVENGLILSPLYDKLFDLGYITFDKNTKLIISNKLLKEDINTISFNTDKIYILKCSSEMKVNFEYHNDMIFRK